MTTCYYFFIHKSLTRKNTAALTAILQEFQSCCIGVGNSEMFLSRLIVNYCKLLLFVPINNIRTRKGIPRSPIHFQLPSILNIIYLRNVDFPIFLVRVWLLANSCKLELDEVEKSSCRAIFTKQLFFLNGEWNDSHEIWHCKWVNNLPVALRLKASINLEFIWFSNLGKSTISRSTKWLHVFIKKIVLWAIVNLSMNRCIFELRLRIKSVYLKVIINWSFAALELLNCLVDVAVTRADKHSTYQYLNLSCGKFSRLFSNKRLFPWEE